MSVSIENTSGIPIIVWVIGLVIIAIIIVYAISRGHHVKIGPLEFDAKDDRSKQQPSTKEETKLLRIRQMERKLIQWQNRYRKDRLTSLVQPE